MKKSIFAVITVMSLIFAGTTAMADLKTDINKTISDFYEQSSGVPLTAPAMKGFVVTINEVFQKAAKEKDADVENLTKLNENILKVMQAFFETTLMNKVNVFSISGMMESINKIFYQNDQELAKIKEAKVNTKVEADNSRPMDTRKIEVKE